MSTYAPTAPLWRRVIALVVDWAIATAISAGFLDNHPLATVAVFAAITWILLATRGATIGHTLVGLTVRRADGGPVGPRRAFIRTLGLCLVIPAVVWDPQGRGLHDLWAGTVVTERRAPVGRPRR
ncbi:RDD family protein [Georgenia faecalis]|uniref:RDD family protein n=1 Tax=Georgenia faecalis TaxID=2483799 RepID=A0ABV9DAX3_9MICO|nr:RDD family protein [Georgenia faecalis]